MGQIYGMVGGSRSSVTLSSQLILLRSNPVSSFVTRNRGNPSNEAILEQFTRQRKYVAVEVSIKYSRS